MYILQGRFIPDLCDLAHVVGMEARRIICMMHLAHDFFWNRHPHRPRRHPLFLFLCQHHLGEGGDGSNRRWGGRGAHCTRRCSGTEGQSAAPRGRGPRERALDALRSWRRWRWARARLDLYLSYYRFRTAPPNGRRGKSRRSPCRS